MISFRNGLVSVVLFSLVSSACAQVGKVTVVVSDYVTGEPISNVEVSAGFPVYDSWGAGNPNRVYAETDTKGRCSLTGRGNGRRVTVRVKATERYYGDYTTIRFNDDVGVFYKPWNPSIELRLKAVRNPIPLFAKQLYKIQIPKEGEPVGFDLLHGDWVIPFGDGKVSDFVFKMSREAATEYISELGPPNRKRTFRTCGVILEVTGSNDGDGFLAYPASERDRRRGLRLPYEAPGTGYSEMVTKTAFQKQDEAPYSDVNEDQNYFFRVRTIKDSSGNIVSALYGKIHGDFKFECSHSEVTFIYYLNPTPNDRNVEFDGGNSLFENLSSMEKVD